VHRLFKYCIIVEQQSFVKNKTIPIHSILLETRKTNNNHTKMLNTAKSGDDNDNTNSKSPIVQLKYYFFL